jgi:hypothetical protein
MPKDDPRSSSEASQEGLPGRRMTVVLLVLVLMLLGAVGVVLSRRMARIQSPRHRQPLAQLVAQRLRPLSLSLENLRSNLDCVRFCRFAMRRSWRGILHC